MHSWTGEVLIQEQILALPEMAVRVVFLRVSSVRQP